MSYKQPLPWQVGKRDIQLRAQLLQVTRLSGKGTVTVGCGHSYTAAVCADGSLYTWGTGLGGQLGLGPSVLTAVWPMRISAAFDSIR